VAERPRYNVSVSLKIAVFAHKLTVIHFLDALNYISRKAWFFCNNQFQRNTPFFLCNAINSELRTLQQYISP
jgi:hypothetical protein